MKFDELPIHDKILEGIRKAGFAECTPVQAQTLPAALEGKDIAAQAQTGTGKTAAFLIGVFSRMLEIPSPESDSSPRVLIIAPTRELAVQIDVEARLLAGPAGFRIVSVYGGIDYQKQREDISKGVDILIGTPGRLIDYLKQKVYSLKKTQFLVIDEADRMFNMGFIADLRFLLRRMAPYDQRQSMLFSATLSHRVLELCYEHMNMPEQFSITPETITVEQIKQELYHVGMSEKLGLLIGLMRKEKEGRFLIFSNTKAVVERLERFLNANGFPSAAITGDRPQNVRMRVLSEFKAGKLKILVATDVASRGLHIDGVTHVINYDLTQDPEDYVHRIGRTGRAGAKGKAITFACEEYVHSLHDVEDYIKHKIPMMPIDPDMIVTDYKKVSRYPAKKPGAGNSTSFKQKNKPPFKDKKSYGSNKPGQARPASKKSFNKPARRQSPR